MFKFRPDFFDHIGKWFDEKAKVNFEIYSDINWETNNENVHIARYLINNKGNQTMKFGQLIE